MSNQLLIQDIQIGEGLEIQKGQIAVVHYTGTLEDGFQFDSSIDKNKPMDRNKPFEFQLGAGMVVSGWDNGVVGMKVGGKRKLTIPSDMAYGDFGIPQAGIPGGATLVFDVELLGIK